MTYRDNLSESAKLIIIEEHTKSNTSRIEKLEGTLPLMNRMEAILETQVEINKMQSKQFESASANSERTFNAINNSLSKLNYTTERLKEDTEKAQQATDEKIEAVRVKVENDIDKRKIDTSDWGIKVFYWIVMIICSMIAAWAMSQTGLN